jgi:hypothetical protein
LRIAVKDLTGEDLPEFNQVGTIDFEKIGQTLEAKGDPGIALFGRLETLEAAEEEISGRLDETESSRLARIEADRANLSQAVDAAQDDNKHAA